MHGGGQLRLGNLRSCDLKIESQSQLNLPIRSKTDLVRHGPIEHPESAATRSGIAQGLIRLQARRQRRIQRGRRIREVRQIENVVEL